MSWMNSVELHLQEKDAAGYVTLKNCQVAGFIAGEIQEPILDWRRVGGSLPLRFIPRLMAINTRCQNRK